MIKLVFSPRTHVAVYPQTQSPLSQSLYIIDGTTTLLDNLLAFRGHIAPCDGVSRRPHRFGMPVFGLCISQPVQCGVSRVRFAVQKSGSDQPEGSLSFTTHRLVAQNYVPCWRIFLGCVLQEKSWGGSYVEKKKRTATFCLFHIQSPFPLLLPWKREKKNMEYEEKHCLKWCLCTGLIVFFIYIYIYSFVLFWSKHPILNNTIVNW